MAAYYDNVRIVTAFKHGISPNEVNSRQMRRTMADLDIIERDKMYASLERLLANVDKNILAARRGQLESAMKYHTAHKNFTLKLVEASRAPTMEKLKELQQSRQSLARDRARLMGKMKEPDRSMLNMLEDQALQAKMTGGNKATPYIEQLLKTNPFVSGGRYIDQRKVDKNAGVLEILKRVNDLAGGENSIFELDEQGRITNMAALREPDKDNPLIARGMMSESQIIMAFDERARGANVIEQYQQNREDIIDTEKTLNDLQANADASIDKMLSGELSPEAFQEQFAEYQDFQRSMDDALTNVGSFDALDREKVLEHKKDLEAQLASRERLERKIQEYATYDESGYSKYEQELAQIVASDNWRAWAADNGFDELGRAEVDADGVADPSTYVPGRDDLNAIRLFNRQQKRGAGRYGMKTMFSGEIVQFELDGKMYEGARLKLHASDPPGSMRVIVGPGEPMIITRDQVPVVNVIDRDPEAESILSKRATRLYRLNKQRIADAAASVRGTDPSFAGEAAMYDGGFVVTKDGNYLPIDEYEAAVNKRMTENFVSGREVDGVKYLVTGGETPRVFRLQSGDNEFGDLDPVEITEDSTIGPNGESLQPAQEYFSAINSDRSIPIGLAKGEVGPNGEVEFDRLIRPEDIKPGMLLALPSDDEEEVYLEAFKREAEAITPESLGFARSDKPFEASRGAPASRTSNVQGFEMRYIEGAPQSTEQERVAADIAPIRASGFEGAKSTPEDVEAQAKEDAEAAKAAKAAAKPPPLVDAPLPESKGEGAEDQAEGSLDPSMAAQQGTQEVDPKAVYAEQGARALKAARRAATLGSRDAKQLAQAYIKLAKAAGIEPENITQFSDQERRAAQLEAAGQAGTLESQRKRDRIRRQYIQMQRKDEGESLDDNVPSSMEELLTGSSTDGSQGEVTKDSSTDGSLGEVTKDASKPNSGFAPGRSGTPQPSPTPTPVEVDTNAFKALVSDRLELNRKAAGVTGGSSGN